MYRYVSTHLWLPVLAFRVDFQIHFVSLVSPVSIHLNSLVNPSLLSSPFSSSITPSLITPAVEIYGAMKLTTCLYLIIQSDKN